LQGFLPYSFNSFNGTLWSMSTEVQFYIFLPLVFMFIMKNQPAIGIAIIGIVCLILRYLSSSNETLAMPIIGGVSYAVLISYGFFGRLFEFSVGIFIASLESKGKFLKLHFLYVILIFIFVAAIRWKGPGWLADPSFGFVYGLLLFWMLKNIEIKKLELLNRYWFLKVTQTFGIYSYSFFLIHWPILLLSSKLSWLDGKTEWIRLIIEGPVCFFVCYFIAKWMFYNIEGKGNFYIFNRKKIHSNYL
jgi:peptidoglycan/LPS O-acetylase OafA/YrhL